MQCTARSKRSQRRCNKNAVKNKKVCRIHGGCTPKRDPKLSFKRLPYLSQFIRSSIGTEIVHAIQYANQDELSALHGEIESLKTEASEHKMAVAENPCLQTISELIETEKRLFEKQRDFNKSYFAPERKVRLVSINWTFRAFEKVVGDNVPNSRGMDILKKMNRLYMSLIFPNHEFQNPLFGESRKIETQYLKTNFQNFIEQAMADKTNPFGIVEVLKIIRKHEDIKTIEAELSILPFGITVDEVFQVYQSLREFVNEISGEGVLLEKLLRSLRNIGYGIFQDENYQAGLNYPTFSEFVRENDGVAA